MVRALSSVGAASTCVVAALMVSCGSAAVQILPIAPEQSAGPVVVTAGQGVLVIQNDSETLPVTCVLIRRTSFDPDNQNLWGVNRLPGGSPIGPADEAQIGLAEALYDIAIIRPSLDPAAANNDETHLEPAIFLSGGKLLRITVNDFSFEDIPPNCN